MRIEDASEAAADILKRELEEDYVGVWKISWHLRRLLPQASDDEIRNASALVLVRLTDAGAVVGELSAEGDFVSRCGDASDVIAELMVSWRRLGRDPNIGELGWLVKQAPARR